MKKILGLILLLGLFVAGTANGAVVNYTVAGSPGVTVGVDDEKQFFTLTDDLYVKNGSNIQQTIEEGTVVSSHFISAEGNGIKSVAITFSDIILGFIYNETSLQNSNYLSYKPDTFAYSGINISDDYVSSSDDLFSGLFTLTGGIDHVRVITAAVAPVPVPAALWLFGSGLLAFVGFGKLRRKEISAAA